MEHNKRILTLGAIMVALVAVVGLSVASFAASNDETSQAPQDKPSVPLQDSADWQARKAEMEAKKTAIDAAIAANDYQAWVQAVGSDSPQAQAITADEFPRFIEAYNLAEEGRAKLEQARQINEELGLKPGPGKGPGKMGKFGQGEKPGCPFAADNQPETAQ